MRGHAKIFCCLTTFLFFFNSICKCNHLGSQYKETIVRSNNTKEKREHAGKCWGPTYNILSAPVCTISSCIDEPSFSLVEEPFPFSLWNSYWLINILDCQVCMSCLSGGDDGLQDISVIQIYELITELSQLQGEKTAIF